MDPRKWAWNRVAPEPFHLARSHDNTICYGCQHFLLNKCNKYVNTRNFPQFIAILIPMFALWQLNFAGNPPKLCQNAAGYYYILVIFVTISPSAPPQRGLDAPMRAIYKRKSPPTEPAEPPCGGAFLPEIGRKATIAPQNRSLFDHPTEEKSPTAPSPPFQKPRSTPEFRPLFSGSIPGLIPRLTCKHKFLKGI